MLKLNYDDAQKFVESKRFAEWDGWDILIFKKNPRAYTNPQGIRKNGEWGFQTRIQCNSEGYWLINESRRAARN